MVQAKRPTSPPQRDTHKSPRLVSWKNYARSCFAAAPSRAVSRAEYIHWKDDLNHAVMYELSNVIVAVGALPPYASTAFHSHHHNTFVLPVIDTPGFTLQNLQPPHYLNRHAEKHVSLDSAACFSQCPFSSKLPLVHRGITTHHPVAFLMIESSTPPLRTRAPTFLVAENSAVTVNHKPPSNFWAAAELKIESGAEATLDARKPFCPLPLARFICRIQCSLDNLSVQTPQRLVSQTFQKTLGGTFVQTMAIIGFMECTDTRLQIRNLGQQAWSGIIVDIFGLTSP